MVQLNVWLAVKDPSEAVTVTLYGVVEAAPNVTVPGDQPATRIDDHVIGRAILVAFPTIN
jgi:hypothetical protein